MSKPLPATGLVSWWDLHSERAAEPSRADTLVGHPLSRLSVA